MNLKKIAGSASIAGALGAAALGITAGTAHAHPGPWPPPGPPGPHVVDDGHWNPLPPGQEKQYCPWQSPPGHWVGGPHGVPCT
jgi:hypothetical protein